MTLRRIYIYFAILFISTSCSRQEIEEVKNIGEAEYYFDEKLSCISQDQNGDCWVGSDTGDIFRFKDNNRTAFDLGEGRIYKITSDVSENNDTIFWIGVRNSGLQKWKKQGERFEKIETYPINFKGERYSAYDLVRTDRFLYTATSQGIYYLRKDQKSDSLTLLYPTKEFLSKQNGYSFVTHNICQYKDSLLLVSTQEGVFIYNTQDSKSRFMLKDNDIEHVSVYNDTIYSVSTAYLYLNKPDGTPIDRIKIGNGLKLYYQIQGIHYLLGTNKLILSNDLKDFRSVNLRRTIPMNCRNMIVADSLNNFTYLLTENAIWKIPNNIDAFKTNKQIKALCSNFEDIYYLTSKNELYVQNKESNKASWIYTFAADNLIQWIGISGDQLYLYNTNNEVQKMTISKNWVKNLLLHSPHSIVLPKSKIISAKIRVRGGHPAIYLGIQDGLIIANNEHIDTVSQLSNAYITSMFEHPHTDRLYVSTLNDGVYYLNQNNEIKQVPKTDKLFFIQDIITTNDHSSNLIMLTNQQIISQTTKDSIRVKGYKKLLYVNDTLFYALPEFGLQKFVISKNGIIDKGLFFRDICFNQNSAFSSPDKIILGSNIGSVIIPTDEKESAVWVDFENAVNINIMLFAFTALLILMVACIVIIIISKKQNAHIVQIKKRKEDLLRRVEDLKTFYSILDESKNKEVSELKDLIEAIAINARYKKDINLKLEEYSLKIGKLNRKVALLIPQKLENQIIQIEQIESFEKQLLLKQSHEAQNKNDIELIKDQVRANELWLQKRTKLFESLKTDIDNLSGCVEIEHVNKGLSSRLISILHDDKYVALDVLISLYDPLAKEIEEISSLLSAQKINNYIQSINEYIEEKILFDQGLIYIQKSLNQIVSKYSANNIMLLKQLNSIELQLVFLRNLDQIKRLTIEYKKIHDQIIRENNEQINKKFDKELASLISDNTQTITLSINKLISSLYEHLSDTDTKVATEILKLANTEGQHAKVLIVLMADLKVKRTLIPGMLGIYGNLNPVISRLINDRIKANETILRAALDDNKNKSIFIYFTLKLLD